MNRFVYDNSNRSIEKFSAYSMVNDPMTSCGCFECISALLPMCNGIMIVNREFPDETPCGMKFSTLAGTVGGGLQCPGFIGHSKQFIASRKFIVADGGLARVCWMPKELKEELRDEIVKRSVELDLGEDFIDKIADETVGTDEETIMNHCVAVEHPAMAMESMF